MLPGQDGGGGQDGALLAAHHTLEGRPDGHLGFAHPHVAAEQPVHGAALFHILLDLGHSGQLILGLVVGKTGFKIPLPLPVRGEGVALGLLAAGIQLDQLPGHLLGGLFHLAAGAGPLGAAQLGQLHRALVAGGGVPAEQVQLGDRHIQGIPLVVGQFQVVLDHPLQIQPLDT